MFGGKGKMFGIGEDGKLTDPAILATQGWLYFMTWAYMVQDPSVKDGKNPKAWLKQVYNDSRVITLEDLTPGPKASAGQSQIIFDTDGNGSEIVQLDGSASKTDEGTINQYKWSINNIEIAEGVNPQVVLPLGIHTVKLTITTSIGASKTSQVVIAIKTPSVSLNKTFKVSSTESNLGNIAANAVDGNLSTRWSSAYSDPQWYQIDLGQKFDISQVIIYWEAASAKNYTIDVSDNCTNWETAVTKSNMGNGARTDDLKELKASGRYIRIYGTARTTTWGYSIFEFEVYGTPRTTAVSEKNQNVFKIYPTTIRRNEHLKVISENTGINADFHIFNNVGQIIRKGIFDEPLSYVFIDEDFYPGIYILRLQYEDFFQTRKFIVYD
jgi:hypothetical protein